MMNAIMNIKGLEKAAKRFMDKASFDFISGGAMDEVTLRDNEKSYKKINLLPRVLRGAYNPNTSIRLFDAIIDMPILVAPMAFQKLTHIDGEQETAKGVNDVNTIMIISTYSTTPMEKIVSELSVPPWFQIYILKDRAFTKALIEFAETSGCKALVFTVDAPIYGKRKREMLNPLNTEICLPDLLKIQAHQPCELSFRYLSDLSSYLDSNISWKDIEWIKSITTLPLFVKGIIRAEDAILAEAHGADGIIISNHGGRQLDTTIASILALPNIKESISNKVKVLIDGGIRSGIDILKALALGADAVLIGRPIMWGLAINGREGVYQVLHTLNSELKLAMILSGCKNINEITEDIIFRSNSLRRT